MSVGALCMHVYICVCIISIGAESQSINLQTEPIAVTAIGSVWRLTKGATENNDICRMSSSFVNRIRYFACMHPRYSEDFHQIRELHR